MSNEHDDTKARLDKTLAEMKELQRKLNTLTPEQREKLAEKVRSRGDELKKAKEQIEMISGALSQRKKSPADRIATSILLKSDFVSQFRRQKSKRQIAKMWCEGWLIPLSHISKKTSLKKGSGIKSFWLEIVSISDDKNLSLMQLGDAWKKSPALALPTILIQMSSLICDYFGEAFQTRILPFDAAFSILNRLVVDVQLEAGIDPCGMEEFETLGKDWILVASGESPSGDMADLTLRAMFAYGWLASILASAPKK